VVGAEEPVGHEEAAEAVAIGRSLAAYRASRLRRVGRGGRPAKLYLRANIEVTVQLPPRDDALVAHLLATAIETDRSGVARAALRNATRAAGRALGRELTGTSVDQVVDALESRGYAPAVSGDCIRLRNCPFHHLVDDHLDLV
jgi:predicted ArsR family transcriptional regulator